MGASLENSKVVKIITSGDGKSDGREDISE